MELTRHFSPMSGSDEEGVYPSYAYIYPEREFSSLQYMVSLYASARGDLSLIR